MLADQFSGIFREEHRQVRDTLLGLITAFENRDKSRIQSLLEQAAKLTGPHFRYEEEKLYPALVTIFGPEYIEQLLSAHDQAIAGARRLVELSGQETLTQEDVTEAIRLIRAVLPHVSDCDGLSIMVERLPESEVRSILEARDSSREADLDLLSWAAQLRTRTARLPG